MSAITYATAQGAQTANDIVSGTLDAINTTTKSSTTGNDSLAPTDKQTAGASVVSQTLDTLNGNNGSSSMANDMSQTYQLSKDVLGAYTSGIGSLADANA